MFERGFYRFLISVVVAGLLLIPHWAKNAVADVSPSVGVPSAPLPESSDFATLTFGKAWDMSEFSDVSQYLNGAGRNLSLTNIQVQNGIFAATSSGTSSAAAYFFPLFPGYQGSMQIGGNLGSLHPINSQAYQCFYIAMKVDTAQFNDGFEVLWYKDQSMSPSAAPPNGAIYPVQLYPEGLTHNWKLYKVDLAHPTGGTLGVNWAAYSPWQGLQVLTTFYHNVNFAIDWIRLTSCQDDPRYHATITWASASSVAAVWVRPVGTTRDIRVATGLNGSSGSYTLDTKGLPPGTYQVGVGTDTTCCSQWSAGELKINPATIVSFDRPSLLSGEDYATAGGNAWNIESSDINKIDCARGSFSSSLLILDTDYPAIVPSNCRGAIGEVDSRVYLHMPAALTANQYRYLSFRMYINGDYQEPADGMIGRWIWSTGACTRVSRDIPYDVGWHTYTVDLYDPYNGTPVEVTSGCSFTPWSQTGQVVLVRFDPNENYTGIYVPPLVFHQEFEWILLTKVDRVAQRAVFPIQLSLNKNLQDLHSIALFYTDNVSTPGQHLINVYNPSRVSSNEAFLPDMRQPGAEDSGSGSPDVLASDSYISKVFLPMVSYNNINLDSNQYYYSWDTTTVPPGEYYICAQADDGYNVTMFCSHASMQVYVP